MKIRTILLCILRTPRRTLLSLRLPTVLHIITICFLSPQPSPLNRTSNPKSRLQSPAAPSKLANPAPTPKPNLQTLSPPTPRNTSHVFLSRPSPPNPRTQIRPRGVTAQTPIPKSSAAQRSFGTQNLRFRVRQLRPTPVWLLA